MNDIAELFSSHPVGTLSTSDGAGQINAAVFGSFRLLDDGRIAVGLGENRTLNNLRTNPQAVLVFFELGQMVFDSRGARIYLNLEELEEDGPLFEETVKNIEKKAGKMAARSISSIAVFRITAARALIDRNWS